MATIYGRWNLGFCLRFGNNLSQMCSFAEFNRPKLNIYTNLQRKHSSGEQIFLVGMEFLNNAHHIGQLEFADLPQIWK